MDLHALKDVIFTDLENPLGYLDDGGFVNDLVPDSANVYGNTVYFFSDGMDWHTLSEEITVGRVSVNTFRGDEHTCTMESSDTWSEKVLASLCVCAKLVYDQRLLPIASDSYSTFESFWNDCAKETKKISLRDYAYTRRGHQKQFINMYNSSEEITGKVTLLKDSVIQMPIRWTLVATADVEMVTFGFRPSFCSGIRVIKLGGPLPVIKRGWSWSDVDFKSLTVPMYDSFIVKTPALEIIDNFGMTFKIELAKKPEFQEAIRAFHVQAGVPEWDGTVHLRTSKTVCVGGFVIAKMSCVRNKDRIDWYTENFFVLPPRLQIQKIDREGMVVEKVGTKRDVCSMDSSPDVKTKRQCIQNDIRGHTKE